MLVDFPKVKKNINTYLNDVFKQSSKQGMGIFGTIGRVRQHEGLHGTYSNTDGEIKDKDYQKISVDQVIDLKQISTMTLADSVRIMEEKGREMGEAMGKYMFKEVDDTIQESGNVIDAKGKKFTLEVILQMLEKLEIPFDEEGNPHFPTLMIHPDMAPRIRELIAQEEKEGFYKERHDKLVEVKRKEWYEKQNNRKLVD